jgi:hypothetical protein
MKKGYVGWLLPDSAKHQLWILFPPKYEQVVAHHCTLKFGVTSDHPLPTATYGEVVGVADDASGVQALILKIDGTTVRPDGNTFHITWSLAPGRKPVESNQVIEDLGFDSVKEVMIPLVPKWFPMGS